jgi:hypothetical protein
MCRPLMRIRSQTARSGWCGTRRKNRGTSAFTCTGRMDWAAIAWTLRSSPARRCCCAVPSLSMRRRHMLQSMLSRRRMQRIGWKMWTSTALRRFMGRFMCSLLRRRSIHKSQRKTEQRYLSRYRYPRFIPAPAQRRAMFVRFADHGHGQSCLRRETARNFSMRRITSRSKSRWIRKGGITFPSRSSSPQASARTQSYVLCIFMRKASSNRSSLSVTRRVCRRRPTRSSSLGQELTRRIPLTVSTGLSRKVRPASAFFPLRLVHQKLLAVRASRLPSLGKIEPLISPRC